MPPGTSEDAPSVKLTDGQKKLRELVHLPCNWPLARLTIRLEEYCFQIREKDHPDSHAIDLDLG